MTPPFPSRLPLPVLALTMREYVAGNLKDTPLRTRLRNALRDEGILELPVWYFLALPAVDRFMKIGGIGEGCRRILDEALAHSGGLEESLGSMTALYHFAETIGTEFSDDRGYGNVVLAVIAGSVSRYDHFISDSNLAPVLQRRGLCPGMPVDQLFVYDAHAGDPPKRTVAEEIVVFLSAKIVDLRSGPLPAELQSIIGAETTVGECALIVALERMQPVQHLSGLDACTRVLSRLASEHLSPEALKHLRM